MSSPETKDNEHNEEINDNNISYPNSAKYSSQSSINSPLSTTNQTKRHKKKKTITPLTIEDIFNQTSIESASILNPPLAKVVLTPRSAEACLKLGINPEVLKIRDLDSFWEAEIDPAVQRMRHEAYMQRRHNLMKQSRIERKKLMNTDFIVEKSPPTQIATLTPEMILQHQKEQSSTLIKMELQRIEKMQKRQEKELEQMIQHEVNRAKIQQELEERIQKERKKEELNKKEQEKRLRLLAEERRLKELQRKALEDAEEETRRNIAKEMHLREKQLADENNRKLQEQKERLRFEEIEKAKLNDEHRKQIESYFENEKSKTREKLELLKLADKKKHDFLVEKQRTHAENLRKKRELIEKRIDQNVKMSKLVEEKRKNDFMEKQNQFEKKREEHLKKLEDERQFQIREAYLLEQRRQMILIQQRKEEEEKAKELLNKFTTEEIHLMEIQQQRQKEIELQKEKKLIRLQMKHENVERVSRIKEYHKLFTLKKIETTDSRVKSITQQRRNLIEERRKAAAEVKRQKETIAKLMDEVRTNASKANKIITGALTGKISIKDLSKSGALSVTSSNSVRRSKSADHYKSKQDSFEYNKPKSTAELLGLSNSKSRKTPKLLDNDLDKGGSFFATSEVAPLPYISPYDISIMR
eukprot:gene20900-27090_t